MNEETENTISPLSRIEGKDVFTPPENYYSVLLSEVQEQIILNTQAEKSKNYEYRLVLASACLSIVFITAIQFYRHAQLNSKETYSAATIDNIENEYLNNVDESELTNDLDNETFDHVYKLMNNPAELSNDEIEEYILSENTDLSSITNEI